jgi:EthD domain
MGRVKMFCGIPRRKDVSPEFFHDHYRHPHGTLGRGISTLRNYVQSHQIHSGLLGENQTRFEACAEAWFDCPADAVSMATEPTYVKYLIPDEPLFINMDEIRYVWTDEEVIMSGPNDLANIDAGDAAFRLDNRPNSVKLLQFIEADGPEPWDQANDIELGQRIGALRHVRCRPYPGMHSEGAFVIGIRELWWPTQWDMNVGVARDREAFQTLLSRPRQSTAFVACAERII